MVSNRQITSKNLHDLARDVKNIYFSRFDEMELEYKLHFASRLASWSNNADEPAASKLQSLRPEVLPAEHKARIANLQNIREELAHKDYERDINNYQARKPYFAKYPSLLLVHNALFRIRHWYCIYGVDERQALFDIAPIDEINNLITRLRNDEAAIRILSTYAINTLYLYEKLYLGNGESIVDTEQIIRQGTSYDTTNKHDMQMLIYLYTHCVIGETLFYYQPISRHQAAYLDMLRQIDKIMDKHFTEINLDNKFEFLVCSRICNFTPTQADRIYDEALRSVGDEGFIVDKHNNNRNPLKQSFLMSEHRNVLFIMSLTPFGSILRV